MKKIYVFLSILLLILTLSACEKPLPEGTLFYTPEGKLAFRLVEEESAVVWYDGEGTALARCDAPQRNSDGLLYQAEFTVAGTAYRVSWGYEPFAEGLNYIGVYNSFGVERARWFLDGVHYYEVIYTYSEDGRPLTLHSSGAEECFHYAVQWEYDAAGALIRETLLDAEGKPQQLLEWFGDTEIYTDLRTEMAPAAFPSAMLSVPKVDPQRLDYVEDGARTVIEVQYEPSGEISLYDEEKTDEDAVRLYRYQYQYRYGNEIEKIYRLHEDGTSTYRRNDYGEQHDEALKSTLEQYDASGALVRTLEGEAGIGLTKITQTVDGGETVLFVRKVHDDRPVDGGCFWSQVFSVDEHGSTMELGCYRGSWPEKWLPGAVRIFTRCNEAGEVVQTVFVSRGNAGLVLIHYEG